MTYDHWKTTEPKWMTEIDYDYFAGHSIRVSQQAAKRFAELIKTKPATADEARAVVIAAMNLDK